MEISCDDNYVDWVWLDEDCNVLGAGCGYIVGYNYDGGDPPGWDRPSQSNTGVDWFLAGFEAYGVGASSEPESGEKPRSRTGNICDIFPSLAICAPDGDLDVDPDDPDDDPGDTGNDDNGDYDYCDACMELAEVFWPNHECEACPGCCGGDTGDTGDTGDRGNSDGGDAEGGNDTGSTGDTGIVNTDWGSECDKPWVICG